MSKRRSDAHKLVQKAVDEPLTEHEAEALKTYTATHEGQAYSTTHSHLQKDLPQHLPDFSMNKRELKAVAAQINKRVKEKRRSRQIIMTVRTVATATAVLLALFFGFGWWFNLNYEPEPALSQPSVSVPTAVPTPPLGEGMKYFDNTAVQPEQLDQLMPELFTKTINQTAEDVGYDIYVPTQLRESLSFVGAMVNPENDAVEIAFRGQTKIFSHYRLWVLHQKPLLESAQNEPLPFAVTPVNEKEEPIAFVLTDSQTVVINGNEAIYQIKKPEWVSSGSIFYVIVAWQENGRQYTLNIATPSDLEPDSVIQTIEGFHLAPLEP